MARYFLELSYKGTAYSGFQLQDNAVTIQSEVQRVMQVYFREAFTLTGSSRTDAGVHALQNFFHFDSEREVQPEVAYNLNALLPADIALKGIYAVPATAHSRFDAVAREYAYYIYRKKDPFMADRGWLYPFPLDWERLQQAAGILKEYRDFTSFSKRNTQVKTFNCILEQSEWAREGETLVYRVRGNRFLRGMVRGLVGTMLRVARGNADIAAFRSVIEAKDCTNADFATPARGLFLEKVLYPPALEACLKQG